MNTQNHLQVSRHKICSRAVTFFLLSSLFVLLFFTLSTTAVSAAVDTEPMTTALDSFAETMQGFGKPFFGIVAVVVGIILIVGGQEGKRLAKSIAMGAIIGAVIVILYLDFTDAIWEIGGKSSGSIAPILSQLRM